MLEIEMTSLTGVHSVKVHQLILNGTALAIALSMTTACKEKKASPKPTAKKAAEVGSEQQQEEEGETTSPGGEDEITELTLELADSSEDFKYQTGSSISIKYNIVGATSSDDVVVGLTELPTGSSMSKSGNTVTFTWTNPTAGNHSFRFVLRNKPACVQDEGSASDCEIDDSDYGSIDVKSYDTTSSRYTLVVTSGTDTTTTTNTGTGTGNNSQLIQQITSLLGNSGGGDINQILQGLGAGQLTQLLGLLQGGGAGLDINQLLPLLGL